MKSLLAVAGVGRIGSLLSTMPPSSDWSYTGVVEFRSLVTVATESLLLVFVADDECNWKVRSPVFECVNTVLGVAQNEAAVQLLD